MKRCSRRTVAMFLASPSNPQGAVADLAYLQRATTMARRFGFMVFSDECYSEIYTQARPERHAGSRRRAVRDTSSFQSLSKRSNLPGLRIGFVDRRPAISSPGSWNCAASLRRRCRSRPRRSRSPPMATRPMSRPTARCIAEKFDLADEIIGDRYGYRRPGRRIFPVARRCRVQAAARRRRRQLWREAGVRVLPGRYAAREQADGSNPGEDFIRVAMVHDKATTAEALRRIVVVAGDLGFDESGALAHDPGRSLTCGRRRRAHYDGMFLCDDFRAAIKRRLRELVRTRADRRLSAPRRLRSRPGRSTIRASATRPARPIRNLLGAPGAIAADLAMQLFGLATLAMIVPAAFWGWRLFTHRRLDRIGAGALRHLDRRLRASLPAMRPCLPRTAHWPLPTGIGGVVGDASWFVLRVDGVLSQLPARPRCFGVRPYRRRGRVRLRSASRRIVTAAGLWPVRTAMPAPPRDRASGDGGDEKRSAQHRQRAGGGSKTSAPFRSAGSCMVS